MMSQVIQVTRDRESGRITKLEVFKEFYDGDLNMQLHHLKNLLEISEVAPGLIKVIENDSESSDKPTDWASS